jgi:hypothetical protein
MSPGMASELAAARRDWRANFRFKRAIRARRKRVSYRPKVIGPYMVARFCRAAGMAFSGRRGLIRGFNFYPSPWRRS